MSAAHDTTETRLLIGYFWHRQWILEGTKRTLVNIITANYSTAAQHSWWCSDIGL